METRKLYYEDPHLQEFAATVLTCHQAQSGWAVTLDATAFYPEGGGQACDIGVLGGVSVLDVREEGGTVVHFCDAPLTVGSCVSGRIDWTRRFDLMQQHTGEHIVSGIIHKQYGFHNTGFHAGSDGMEVDFDGIIPPEDIAWIEQTANAFVWANLPVSCRYPDREELPTIPYRTKKELPWPVRIVDIQGADICACCGIHVKQTGEVGLIKITSCVKLRGGVRIVMRCGNRALRHIEAIYEQNRRVSQLLSAQLHETADAVQKLGDALAAEKQRVASLQKEVFSHAAKAYAGQENVLHMTDGLTGTQLRDLADAIAGQISGCAAVFSGSGSSYSYCLASRAGDLRQLGKNMNQALQGRGGGKPSFQQGSVAATDQQIRQYFAQGNNWQQ